MRRELERLERDMAEAPDYGTWCEAAMEHDELTGMAGWRDEAESADYDWKLIASRVRLVRRLRKENDVPRLAFYLHEELHGNLGNMANPALYEQAKFGTKTLITDYLDEITGALEFLRDEDEQRFTGLDKLRFFKRGARSFGRSALLLSGGATLGLFHVGVIKARWSEDLLPTVICGSSAGSIVAAIVCTHTDEVLADVFDPGYIRMEAWRDFGLNSLFEGRGFANVEKLRRAIYRNVGKITFEQTFTGMGRILNISVSPADPHQFPRLLNYLSAPNVLVRRAVLASCAIPGLFPPVRLKARDFNGMIIDYSPKSTWVDGSLKMDVPKERVARMHNVNHFIVSQTNPHVTPFLTEKDPEGLVPFFWDLVKSTARVNAEHILDRFRRFVDAPALALLLDKAHSVATQSYSGDINVYPHAQAANVLRAFVDPTEAHVADFVADGERSTWPLIERVRNTTRISRCFERCLNDLRAE